MIANGGHRLHHHWLGSDGQEASIRDHQLGAVAIAALAPARLALQQIGVDLLDPAPWAVEGNVSARWASAQRMMDWVSVN